MPLFLWKNFSEKESHFPAERVTFKGECSTIGLKRSMCRKEDFYEQS